MPGGSHGEGPDLSSQIGRNEFAEMLVFSLLEEQKSNHAAINALMAIAIASQSGAYSFDLRLEIGEWLIEAGYATFVECAIPGLDALKKEREKAVA